MSKRNVSKESCVLSMRENTPIEEEHVVLGRVFLWITPDEERQIAMCSV